MHGLSREVVLLWNEDLCHTQDIPGGWVEGKNLKVPLTMEGTEGGAWPGTAVSPDKGKCYSGALLKLGHGHASHCCSSFITEQISPRVLLVIAAVRSKGTVSGSCCSWLAGCGDGWDAL